MPCTVSGRWQVFSKHKSFPQDHHMSNGKNTLALYKAAMKSNETINENDFLWDSISSLSISIILLILSFHFQVRFPLIWQYNTSFGLQIPKTSVSWLLPLGGAGGAAGAGESSSIRSPESLRAWGKSSKYPHCLQTTEMLPCILDRWHMRVLRAAKNSSL